MATIVITGCNRGIGLELCRQYLADGDEVIGICRKRSKALDGLGIRVIDNIDVSSSESVLRLRDALGSPQIDVLINNAGLLINDSLGDIDYDAMLQQFEVNALGPLRVTEALLDNLAAGAKVIIITSRVGSIEDNASGGYYGYRASKTAVNQIGTNLRHDLGAKGVAVAMLHPGLVATDMTGGQGVAVQDSAKGLRERIAGLNLQNSGGFWHAEGYELPW